MEDGFRIDDAQMNKKASKFECLQARTVDLDEIFFFDAIDVQSLQVRMADRLALNQLILKMF